MLNAIKNLLVQKKGKSEAFRTALAEIDIPALAATVDELAAQRGKMLLDASDEAIEKVEQQMAKAQRDLDRAIAARREIETRLDHAEKREARERYEAQRVALESTAQAAARALAERYPNAAREIVGLITAAEAADEAVKRWNAQHAYNPPEGVDESSIKTIELVEARLWENFHEMGFNGSLLQGVRLPVVDPVFAPGIHDFEAHMRGTTLKRKGT